MNIKDRFKPKKRQRDEPSPWPIYVLIFLLILFALNATMLLPQQIVSLFFELEMGFLQFMFNFVRLPVWLLITSAIFVSAFGYAFFPIIYVPSLGKRGKHYFYMRSWYEGDLKWFKLLSGYYLAVNASILSEFGKRVTVIGNVEQQANGNILTLQTAGLEVDISVTTEKRLRYLMEYVKQLEHDIEGRIPVRKEDFMKMMRREANEESK